jgi:site-specific DNA recombinase
MEAFTVLDAKAAPLMRQNVNTDIIIPIHRLRDVAQADLGPYAFEPWRYLPDGSENPDFFMHQPAYRGAQIVVADNNFACGSSREGAVWAMMGMGVRCVIAPTFGPIFFNNCFQNGVLPIQLPRAEVLAIAAELEAATRPGSNSEPRLSVDLEKLGRINVVVVYKVDRLTRSLADFARIVEMLDVHGASFVSVTQQFNTTTSMGRLTLNVLLSFAQFEREVTGERIRDKIAASKRKGMWMGGSVPLGYEVKDRELVVNEAEATTVRDIFDSYVRLGSVAELQAELQRRGILSKRWTSSSGRTWGGAKISRGALYWLLRNPVYVGQVAHKGHIYEGRQAAIVEQSQWERAQALLTEKSASRERRPITPGGRPLAGLLFDDRGNAMSPSYAIKRNGKRYHYYVSQALLQNDKARAGTVPRVPAEEIERLAQEAVRSSDKHESGSATELLRQRIERVVVHADRIEIAKAVTNGMPGDEEGESRTIVVRAKLAHRNRAVVLDDGRTAPDPVLLKALCRAHEWRAWRECQEYCVRAIRG